MPQESQIILASASPRRLELLAQIGITNVKVVPAEIDETPHKNESPQSYVARMAKEKLMHVKKDYPEMKILAADTVVAVGARILGKAENEDDALKFLNILSGRRHKVLTSVIICGGNGKIFQRVVQSVVAFKRLSKAEITDYINCGEWFGKAGGYAIQGRAAAFVKFISGSYSGVVGLPLYEVDMLIKYTD